MNTFCTRFCRASGETERSSSAKASLRSMSGSSSMSREKSEKSMRLLKSKLPLLRSKAPFKSKSRASASKEKAFLRALVSMEKRLVKSKSRRLSALPKLSPVRTLVAGSAICCFTMSLSAASFMTFSVREAG